MEDWARESLLRAGFGQRAGRILQGKLVTSDVVSFTDKLRRLLCLGQLLVAASDGFEDFQPIRM